MPTVALPDSAATVRQTHGREWPKRVLVIDDHRFVRAVLRDILIRSGVESVSEAESGADAISQLKTASPHFELIFCDLQMPDIDGIETIRAIADISADASIVLMSGEDPGILQAAEGLARAHGLTTLGSLSKPVTVDGVHGVLRNGAGISVTSKVPPDRTAPITEAELRAGLRNNQFGVLFQPKIDVRSGALSAVEALVRWRHPQRGAVSPVQFIPLAEESDVIDDLTFFVFAQALAAQAKWRAAGREISVAINLSTRSMSRLDLPDRLGAIAKDAGARPASIVFEITESRVAENVGSLLDNSARLRLKGFQLSIDDFGTGFSTFEQLGRLPFGELKVDRAFVAGAPDDPKKRAILEASLALAQNLGLRSVCEGVETEAEWSLAKSLGTNHIQGFYVAKPMGVEDLVSWRFEHR